MTRRWLARGLAGLALLLLAVLLAIWLLLRASLPPLQGELPAPGLAAPVELQRDARGTASVHAANRRDAAYGIGVAHGQDRFFQMDTLRRAAAGEMAALVGAPGLKIDRATRGHGFRERAEQALRGALARGTGPPAGLRGGGEQGAAIARGTTA